MCCSLNFHAQVPDFSVTTTDGSNFSLYETLNAGNTVALIFFYADDPVTQFYISGINYQYAKWGYGTGDVKFIGISDRDENTALENYADVYPVDFPLAGVESNGDSIENLYEDYFDELELPTYAVICPDHSYTWDIFPLTENAPEIDSAIQACGAIGSGFEEMRNTNVITVFPNPAENTLHLLCAENLFPHASLLQITTVEGSPVMMQKLTGKESNVDISGLLPGIYCITVLSGNALQGRKLFVKMK